MTLVVDAAPLVALGDEADPLQAIVQRILSNEPGQLVLPAPVAAEVDYLLHRHGGRSARRRFLQDLADGRFNVACLEPVEYEVVRRYDEQMCVCNLSLNLLEQIQQQLRFVPLEEVSKVCADELFPNIQRFTHRFAPSLVPSEKG